MKKNKYPLSWVKENFSIKIFCSIPNIATGILIKAGNAHFIVDPGDGILRDLNKELKINDILNISDIFVTHGHHDHVGGVWSLLTYLRVMNKKTPLVIHYPKGCLEIVHIHNAFKKFISNNITYKIILKEISGDKSFTSKKVTIKPFPVIHKEFYVITKRPGKCLHLDINLFLTIRKFVTAVILLIVILWQNMLKILILQFLKLDMMMILLMKCI